MLNSNITLIEKNIFSLSTVSVVRLHLHYISARRKPKQKTTNKQTDSPELYRRTPKLTNSRVQTGEELVVCALYLQV